MFGFTTRVDKCDEGFTLETSALESLYGDQITLSSVDKTKHSALLHWYFIVIVSCYHIKRSDSANPEGSFCFGWTPRGA